MKSRKSGFTLIELLTVLVIIALLVGVLLPALNLVRNTAKEARQKVQFATIEQAIMAFKGDYGDYPHSDNLYGDYGGAQQLAEALVGWDLMGFHPNSAWRSNGYNSLNTTWVYYPPPPPAWNMINPVIKKNLDERKGPYLELSKANVFRLGNSVAGVKDGLFDRVAVSAAGLNPDTYVLCDSFGAKNLFFNNGTKTETVTAGTPILYYKADTSSKRWGPPGTLDKRIYFDGDNRDLVLLGRMTDGKPHPLGYDNASALFPGGYGDFYRYLTDPKMVPVMGQYGWPVNADSYVLISAGADGLYGTADDITNF